MKLTKLQKLKNQLTKLQKLKNQLAILKLGENSQLIEKLQKKIEELMREEAERNRVISIKDDEEFLNEYLKLLNNTNG